LLNIVIPMAGRGSRFEEAGYKLPKPLIPVHGIPMIEVVVNNLRPRRPHRFIFICQRAHARQHGLLSFLKSMSAKAEVIEIDGVTQGAACTVLTAQAHIDNDEPLMIANCDQWINASIDEYLNEFDRTGADGFIMTMASNLPKWSYVRRGDDGQVLDVVEKRVVSNDATVGIYNFAKGSDFVRGAMKMIAAEDRTNGEFYVAPVYSWLIRAGKRIETFSIGSDQNGMYGLGTPADLEWFLGRGFEEHLAREQGADFAKAA
jgi:NDP-sugar pyrophosphorylase family protein